MDTEETAEENVAMIGFPTFGWKPPEIDRMASGSPRVEVHAASANVTPSPA